MERLHTFLKIEDLLKCSNNIVSTVIHQIRAVIDVY